MKRNKFVNAIPRVADYSVNEVIQYLMSREFHELTRIISGNQCQRVADGCVKQFSLQSADCKSHNLRSYRYFDGAKMPAMREQPDKARIPPDTLVERGGGTLQFALQFL